MWLCCSISFLLCQPSCTGRKQLEDLQKKIKILSAAHLILFQVWNGCLWKVILCCQARSGGKTFRNYYIFSTTFSSIMKWWSHLTNLTLKIDVFCLSWTFSSCSWSLLSNWTSGDLYLPLDLLTEFWPDTNILLFPVAFDKRFLSSSKSSLHHLRANKELCISTRTFAVFLVYLEWNKWSSCQARVYINDFVSLLK